MVAQRAWGLRDMAARTPLRKQEAVQQLRHRILYEQGCGKRNQDWSLQGEA
jgi:hypothetical protein